MTADFELAPYGAYPPGRMVRAAMALTRGLPANWLGLRTSMPFRRLAIGWLGAAPIDTLVWDARMRLYPSRSICEKMAVFTPQMYDVIERDALADALDRRVAEGKVFSFVDIGANVGLYSLFVASRGGPHARVLAIEPQPGVLERLTFNLKSNPGFNVVALPVAVADREGEAELVIHARDAGGAHFKLGPATDADAETVRVPCRLLAAILEDAGFATIDALKIDIEGAEHLALAPLMRDAPKDLLPRLLIIEDRGSDWPIDLLGLIGTRGYVRSARSRHNIIFRLT